MRRPLNKRGQPRKRNDGTPVNARADVAALPRWSHRHTAFHGTVEAMHHRLVRAGHRALARLRRGRFAWGPYVFSTPGARDGVG